MKKMDHVEYPKTLKTKSELELRFIIKDANDAMTANPQNENNSYYADEICYCSNEIYRRLTKKSEQCQNFFRLGKQNKKEKEMEYIKCEECGDVEGI